MVESPTIDPDDGVVAAAVTLAVFAVAFGGLVLDVSFWWVAFPVGFGGALPLAVALARRRREEPASERPDRAERSDALEELRSRYARGEIDEAEFERRVERLLETETDEDAAAYAERDTRSGRETTGAVETSTSAERDRKR